MLRIFSRSCWSVGYGGLSFDRWRKKGCVSGALSSQRSEFWCIWEQCRQRSIHHVNIHISLINNRVDCVTSLHHPYLCHQHRKRSRSSISVSILANLYIIAIFYDASRNCQHFSKFYITRYVLRGSQVFKS